jgi:hypothetical protein
MNICWVLNLILKNVTFDKLSTEINSNDHPIIEVTWEHCIKYLYTFIRMYKYLTLEQIEKCLDLTELHVKMTFEQLHDDIYTIINN